MVLEGSCEFDGEPMAALRPHRGRGQPPYGFIAGPDGLSFLVVRQGAASFAVARLVTVRPHRPRRLRRRRHRPAAPAASTSASATARSRRSAHLDDDDRGRGDRRRRHDRRARHRRRAHALRPADHVRPVRDDVVLPRRHHRRRGQLRLLGRAVQARRPRVPLGHLRPGREHGPDRAERDHVGRVRDVPRVPRAAARASSASTSRATSATPTCGAG